MKQEFGRCGPHEIFNGGPRIGCSLRFTQPKRFKDSGIGAHRRTWAVIDLQLYKKFSIQVLIENKSKEKIY